MTDDWQEIESAPYGVDVELWSHREGKCFGRHTETGYEAGFFIREWVNDDGKVLEPTHWRPVRPPADDETGANERALFHNRIRIIVNLDDSAFPPELREDNPTSAEHWSQGGFHKVQAFIYAPDLVAAAIWQAVLDYERAIGKALAAYGRTARKPDSTPEPTLDQILAQWVGMDEELNSTQGFHLSGEFKIEFNKHRHAWELFHWLPRMPEPINLEGSLMTPPYAWVRVWKFAKAEDAMRAVDAELQRRRRAA